MTRPMRGLPPATLEEIVSNRALREAARTALLWHDRAVVLGRVASLTAQRAESIASLLARGSTVATLMSDTPGVVTTTLAIWRAGGTVVPLDPRLAPEEVARRLAHTGASGLIAHEEHVERAERALGALESRGRGGARKRAGVQLLVSRASRLVPGRIVPRRERARGGERDVRVNEVAFIAYPGGDGAADRAVVLTHTNVMASVLRVSIARGDGPEDVALATRPLWDVSALVADVLSRLVTGGAVAIVTRHDVGTLLAAIEQHRTTDVCLSDEARTELTEAGRIPARAVRSVRKLVSARSRSAMTVRRALADRFPDAETIETYGKLETTDGILTARHGIVFRKPDTLGLPHPGLVVSILDPAGRALKPGAIGEIACRGAVVMRGYHRAPALTRQVLGAGWLRTGDLGCIDADGEVQLVGAREKLVREHGA